MKKATVRLGNICAFAIDERRIHSLPTDPGIFVLSTGPGSCLFGGGHPRLVSLRRRPSSARVSSEAAILGSSLINHYIAEREEILRHKWIESEKAGRDIGIDRALLDWVHHHRRGWRKRRSR